MKRKRRSLLVEFLEDRRLLTTTALDVQVAASSDDAEERPSGSVTLTSSDLEMTQDKANQQIVGMRFTGLNIPPGASIQDAYLQFQADETGSDPTSLAIFGQAIDNAPTFTSTYGDIAGRATTTASVSWSPAPWNTRGEAGPAQRTPNIAAVIQEIVNRPGWSNGNSLAIIVTGTGARTAESYNGAPSAAPLLHLEYETGNQTPTTSGIANANVNTDAPDTVIDLFAAFDDAEDPDPALTYTIADNTNSSLFTAITINGVVGTLTLDYAPATTGTADITIRATDTGTPPLFVETTFTVSVSPVNQPPTTTGIADVTVGEDAGNTAIGLFAAFHDPEDPDSSLTYTIQANTNSALFASTPIDGALGTLTLDYAPDANGTADVTVRATDTGFPVLFVDTTFRVTVTEVNDIPALTSGSINNLTVVQNSPATSLNLAGLVYGPGGGVDENGQTLSYSVTTAPSSTLGEIVLSDGSTVVTPGAYTLAQIQGMQFHAAADVVGGPETFTFTITDNGMTNGAADFKTLTQSLQISVIEFIPDPITIEVQVAASSDDAEERPTGSVKLTSSDLEMTQDKTNQQIVGMRFTGLNIPPGASIQNAYLQFQADETGSDPTSLTIYAEDVDNASTFTSTSGNISSRTTTNASAPWSPAPWNTRGEAGPDQQTPNIAAVIQEIVNRPGWSGGNSLAIIVTGTGKRTAESFNGVPAAAPLLHVEYVTGDPPGNQAPTTSGIADVNVNVDASDTVIDLFAAFDDIEDPDTALTYTLENNSNPSLFTSTTVDGLQGTLTLEYAPATEGTAMITVRATDTGTPPLFVETAFTVNVTPDNPNDPVTIEVRVAARSDDAEERFSGVTKYVSKDLDMVDDPTQSGVQQTIGIRFNGLTIPQGAVITSAYVQFEASASDDDVTTLQFHGEDTDNAATFDTIDFNVTSRPVTNATVAWSPPDWTTAGEAGVNQQTPNIASVIQEIVDRAGWAAGNSMALIITGFGERAAVSYDGDVVNGTNGAPLLHVEYTDQSPSMAPLTGNSPPAAALIDEGQLTPTVDEAISGHSQSAGSGVLTGLLDFEAVDLLGNQLDRGLPNAIQIDVDAAGFGWFVDTTPSDNLEYMYDTATNQLVAPSGNPASVRVDLLTDVMHELGHEHTDSDTLIHSKLPLGTRRLASELSGSKVDAFYELFGSDR